MTPHSGRRALALSVAAAALVAVSGACGGGAAMVERFVPRGHDRFARDFLTAARAGDTARADSMLAPATRQIAHVGDSLRVAMSELPAGPIDTLRIVGVRTFNSGEVERSTLTYELHTPAGWGIVTVGVAEEMGLRYVEGMRTNRLAASLEATNAFRFAGKGAANFIVLLLALTTFAFSLGTAIAAARTRELRRRWGWAFVALLGTSPVVLDWTTGRVGWRLLSVQLFSAGFVRAGPAAPWLVMAACPVGAVAVLERIRKARRSAAAAAAAAASVPVAGASDATAFAPPTLAPDGAAPGPATAGAGDAT